MRLGLDLAAQRGHAAIHAARGDHHAIAPHRVHNAVAGERAAGALEEVFEQSEAFSLLAGNASLYRFFMSFPRDNAYGYRNEPWHWAYRRTP